MPSKTANRGWTPILRRMLRKSKKNTKKLKAFAHPLCQSTMALVVVGVQVVLAEKKKRKRPMTSCENAKVLKVAFCGAGSCITHVAQSVVYDLCNSVSKLAEAENF